MNKKRGFDAEEDPQEPQKSSLLCCAAGCPLPGVFSPSTTGSREWMCWAHDRTKEASQWPLLTQGINANLWLFNLAGRISVIWLKDMEGQSHKIDAFLEAKGRPDLKRLKDAAAFERTGGLEPRHAWITRLRNAAYAAAFEFVGEHWQGMKPPARSVRSLTADLVEGMAL